MLAYVYATIKHKHPDSLKFLINILGDYGFFYDVEILNVPVRFKFSYLYQNRISVKVKKKFELFDMTRKEEATLWYFISEEKIVDFESVRESIEESIKEFIIKEGDVK